MGVAGTPKTEQHPHRIEFESESLDRAIFRFAYMRIWSGRILRILEKFSWFIAVGYIASLIFDFTPFGTFGFLDAICRYGLPVGTPIIIVVAILKAHVLIGTGDSSLKCVPLKGFQILGPRFLAILLTWLRLVIPWVVVMIALVLAYAPWYPGFVNNPILSAFSNYLFINWYIPYEIGLRFGLAFPKNFLILLLLFAQAIGWGLLPISWGLMWASLFHNRGGHFLYAYLLYLLIPGFTYLILTGLMFRLDFHDPFTFWIFIFISEFGSIILAALFFYAACLIWNRRTG